MSVRLRERMLRVMALLFTIVLVLHLAAGGVALLSLAVPLVTEKGGGAHRRAGWVYVAGAAALALTGLFLCARLALDGRWRSGLFLAYVGVLAGESALLGIRVLRAKRSGASRSAIDLVPPMLLVVGGAAVAALGIEEARILFVAFALLGAAQGVAHLRFLLRAPSGREARLLAHMGAMGTSCITTLTAFVVANAPRLGMRTFDPTLWFLPIGVLAVALVLWRRAYARRLAPGARGA